jgi:maltose/moltooligosaccharide transporter
LWTVIRVKEYAPEEMAAFAAQEGAVERPTGVVIPRNGLVWAIAGLIGLAAVIGFELDKQLYVLAGGLLGFGAIQLLNQHASAGKMVREILSDLAQMPDGMRHLAQVQFFSWIGLFIMWIFTTPVVTQYVYGSTDTASPAYNEGAEWVGVMFAVYNGVAALAAFALPALVKKIGAAKTHAVCLGIGAISYLGLMLIRDANLLLLPMLGVGVVWASILMMPYVMLANLLPQDKLGVYMGIFNFFIVLPQLITAALMGVVMRVFFPDQPLWTMLCAAVSMAIAALLMLRPRN